MIEFVQRLLADVPDVGPNITRIVLAVIGLAGAWYARSAAKNLKNNGGSTALDKLQKGHEEMKEQNAQILGKLDTHDARLFDIEQNTKDGTNAS